MSQNPAQAGFFMSGARQRAAVTLLRHQPAVKQPAGVGNSKRR